MKMEHCAIGEWWLIIKEILSRFNILTKENKLLNYRTILKEHPLNNIDESGVKVTTNLIFNLKGCFIYENHKQRKNRQDISH